MPRLPAPRRVARAGGAREARGVRERDVLGPADPRLRRSRGAGAHPRPRARGARRQPHRAASSPATARATSSSRRCIAPGFANQPTSRARRATAWRCATRGSPRRCAARRRRTSRRRRSATRACRSPRASSRRWPRLASSSASGRSPGTPRCACSPLRGVELPRPRPRFGHLAEARLPGAPRLLGCFHPSQQNTFTGRLTPAMLDEALRRARELAAPDLAGAAHDDGRVGAP